MDKYSQIPHRHSRRGRVSLRHWADFDDARGGADNFNDISTQQFGVNGSVINYYDGFARTQGDAGWIQIYNTNAYIAFNAEL